MDNQFSSFVKKIFLKASEQQSLDIVEECLAHGVDINLVDEDKCNALHYATSAPPPVVVQEIEQIVQILIAKGIDIDAQDRDGRTALMLAGENYYGEVLNILLNNGADVQVQDNQGRTCLWYVLVRSHTKDWIKATQLLLNKEVDIEHKDKFGKGIVYDILSKRTFNHLTRQRLDFLKEHGYKNSKEENILMQRVKDRHDRVLFSDLPGINGIIKK